jgi:hypothetical protein
VSRRLVVVVVAVAVALAGCGRDHVHGAPADAPPQQMPDAPAVADAAGTSDAAVACAVEGAPGVCIATTACGSDGDHTPFPGFCPGSAAIQCCIDTPDVADNPPTPTGYTLMPQADVTAAMTTWAVMILNDPAAYPMFSTTTMTFGGQLVLARVEWHPPDFQNSVVHRGVTLYIPV